MRFYYPPERSSKKKLISLRQPKNERYKKSITYQGPKLWNSLPAHLQKMDSYYDFKKELKKRYQAGSSSNKITAGKRKAKRKIGKGKLTQGNI